MSRLKQPLFYPTLGDTTSTSFEIPFDGQVTIMAMGLASGDSITFEAILVPAVEPQICQCPPYPATLPSVAATVPLMCCGNEVTLTEDNPYVVIDAPQEIKIRAISNISDPDFVWVWVYESSSTGFPGCCGGG